MRGICTQRWIWPVAREGKYAAPERMTQQSAGASTSITAGTGSVAEGAQVAAWQLPPRRLPVMAQLGCAATLLHTACRASSSVAADRPMLAEVSMGLCTVP